MSLRLIVAALGGDLYGGGTRASVPAPGHSAADRSVSLWMTEGRIVIHGFGAADWRVVRDDLRARGFIDSDGRLLSERGGGRSPPPRPDLRHRLDTARRLWAETAALTPGDPADHYLRRRAVVGGRSAFGLGFHPRVPLSVYRQGGRTAPALIARISDAEDRLTGIEVAYLAPNGLPAPGLRVGRKTVGRVPPGAAVRLCPAAPTLLVAEGVITTLSAMERFGLPGWALMGAANLAVWRPPLEAGRILIAADRDPAGLAAAARLSRRLRRAGLAVQVASPQPPFGDWNEAAAAVRSREEGG